MIFVFTNSSENSSTTIVVAVRFTNIFSTWMSEAKKKIEQATNLILFFFTNTSKKIYNALPSMTVVINFLTAIVELVKAFAAK